MKRLIPDSIAARTLLLLIVLLTISHALSVALYLDDRASALRRAAEDHNAERMAVVARLVDGLPPRERERLLGEADLPRFHVFWSAESATGDPTVADDARSAGLRRALAAHLGSDAALPVRITISDGDASPGPWREHLERDHGGKAPGAATLVSLGLADGSWLNFSLSDPPADPVWSLRFALSFVFMLAAVVVASALVVRHLTRPLATFALAAERLGTDVRAPPITERGPAEVRRATRAFNRMQERIRRFVEDRTQMLAAISHDLGTPITRLRLRAEFVDDEEQRGKMLADLDEMEQMVASALAFARDDAAAEQPAVVDLRSLVQRVCDEMSDAGHEVALDAGPQAVRYSCRPAALRRALANLIDNAAKYGRRARVSLRIGPAGIVIGVEDDGPGIPEELRERAFRPFSRLETSRNRETGGTGLGLAVARTIIRAHGGDITLSNRETGGLRAEIRLPRQPQ